MVLGLRVKSLLPDPMAVLLTVAQNRFLLNSLRGEGFLNMRLTDAEAQEAVGIDPVRQAFTGCIQSTPCVLEKNPRGEFFCAGHHALFLPALLRGSAFWERVEEGLALFGVPPENLSAVTGFRLDMVQRPRFSVRLFPPTPSSPGTYGFLLGDAANAIHFWPGRGLNSGLASAISLARCLSRPRRGPSLRDADLTRHEAVMSMLQYRHKSRAWLQMVTADADGNFRPIKDIIAQGIAEGDEGHFDREADLNAFLRRLGQVRSRLAPRIEGMPDEDTLRAHLEKIGGSLIHTLVVSDQWDSGSVGGEEVDVDWLLGGAAASQAPVATALPQVGLLGRLLTVLGRLTVRLLPVRLVRLPAAGLPVARLAVPRLAAAGLAVALLPVALLPVALLPVPRLAAAGLAVAGLPVAGLAISRLPIAGCLVAGHRRGVVARRRLLRGREEGARLALPQEDERGEANDPLNGDDDLERAGSCREPDDELDAQESEEHRGQDPRPVPPGIGLPRHPGP
jgi:hypothetical protein